MYCESVDDTEQTKSTEYSVSESTFSYTYSVFFFYKKCIKNYFFIQYFLRKCIKKSGYYFFIHWNFHKISSNCRKNKRKSIFWSVKWKKFACGAKRIKPFQRKFLAYFFIHFSETKKKHW